MKISFVSPNSIEKSASRIAKRTIAAPSTDPGRVNNALRVNGTPGRDKSGALVTQGSRVIKVSARPPVLTLWRGSSTLTFMTTVSVTKGQQFSFAIAGVIFGIVLGFVAAHQFYGGRMGGVAPAMAPETMGGERGSSALPVMLRQ